MQLNSAAQYSLSFTMNAVSHLILGSFIVMLAALTHHGASAAGSQSAHGTVKMGDLEWQRCSLG